MKLTEPFTLDRYEPEFIDYIKDIPRPARVILVDPIGVGRCYSVTAAIRCLFEDSDSSFNCLVIVPWTGALLKNWRDLLIGFGLPDVQLFDEGNSTETTFSDVTGGIVVASAGSVVGHEEPLWNINWDVVVIEDPNSWLEDAWLKEDVEEFWSSAHNVSLAIGLCPYLSEGDWLKSNLSTGITTTIVQRQHQKIPIDSPSGALKDPTGEQAALQLLKALSNSIDGSYQRDRGGSVASIIRSIDLGQFWKNEHSPHYDRIMRLLLAIGQVLSSDRPGVTGDSSDKGLRLPSETELAKLFQVSRITSRRALEELRAQGFVHRDRGGSYLDIGRSKPNSTRTGVEEANAIDKIGDLYRKLPRKNHSGFVDARTRAVSSTQPASDPSAVNETIWETLRETCAELTAISSDQRDTILDLQNQLIDHKRTIDELHWELADGRFGSK